MKSKKWVVVTTAVCVLLGTSVIAFASNPIKLIINGDERYTETPPQIINGRVMVPLTAITEVFNKIVSYNANSMEVEIRDPKEKVISQMDNIEITGKESEDGIYEHLQLVTDQFSRKLDGYNVTNPTYAPEIMSVDLKGDGNKEIAVILTTGYGTGVYISELHLREGDSGIEIPVEDALIAMKKQFTGTVTSKGIDMKVNGHHTLLTNDKLNTEREHWFEEPVIGNIIYYNIENNILKASAAVQISPGEFIGELEIIYTYKNGIFQVGEAIFSQDEE
ncbi:stalk domain-containing protein [Paenibacillus glacialis]|uniref:stalk domain-containing protein n=1 Tax=Paenibacillus glacialis TaxID=494026 RepID=UPI000AD45308|nr:stalk domain-containing protein [Paenibacillus glacialis]